MDSFGLIELFYGLPWSRADRESYAGFLASIGFQFYVYGPKADNHLRKNWRDPFPTEQLDKYSAMRETFTAAGLRFGMVLSPQGLNQRLGLADRQKLKDKIQALCDLGLHHLGIFFDDMKSAPDMAAKQIEIIELARSVAPVHLLFCPSYYSDDSLLEFMFGERPAKYLETLGEKIPADVDIVWTGENIISQEISAAHLRTVAEVLRRKPFICDNFYADDGPIGCNFLRLLPPSGRDVSSFASSAGWALNPMNQAALSKIALQAFAAHVHKGQPAEEAFEKAVRENCGRATGEFILAQHQRFAHEGLIEFSEEEKAKWRRRLSENAGPVEKELIQWLDGYYAVALEAVIGQSCYDGN
jgi:hypothetical protein